jgi:hypothetical protein
MKWKVEYKQQKTENKMDNTQAQVKGGHRVWKDNA